MAVLYLVEEKPLCFTTAYYYSSFSKRESPRLLNGFNSYFHTISGLGVI